jgi:hypothetical protein
MAVLYVRSTDGNDADNGSTWALAKATLAGAFAAASAGDTIYVSDSHAESQATAITLTSPGTSAAPCRVLCVDDSAEPPTALATTATVDMSGDLSGLLGMLFLGCAYYHGITFLLYRGYIQIANPSSSSLVDLVFDACAFDGYHSGFNYIEIGHGGRYINGCSIVWNNTRVKFSDAGQYIKPRTCNFLWKNTNNAVDSAGTAPTTLIQPVDASNFTFAKLVGLDLSHIGSSKNIITASNNYHVMLSLENCKLGASVSFTTGTVAARSGFFGEMVNCDSGDTQTRYQKTVYQGSIYSETTIKRTGGASDATTGYSRKMVSSANSQFLSPLALETMRIWNEGTAEMTATVHVVTDNVTLTNAECWMEVEYQGTSGYPLSVVDMDDRAADILATPANQAASTETWTTTGLSTPVYQKLESTFTPAEKGWIICRVMLAKASTTVYVCPKMELSTYSPSVQQMTPDGIVNSGEYPAVGTVQTDEVYRFNDLTGTLAAGGGGGGFIQAGSGRFGVQES